MNNPMPPAAILPGSKAALQDSTHVSANSNAPHSSAANASVSDSGGKVLAIIALVASCVALGAVTMYVILAAQLIDSKIQAGAAKSEALANQARVDARVSLDEVQRMRSRLEAKGIYSTDH